MSENEFMTRLYKLFENDYIYNNQLSDELDIILKELIEHNYRIEKSIYKKLLKCFTIKTSLNKTGICPIVKIEKKYDGFHATFANTNKGPEIMIDGNTNQNNILLDMETIFHETRHFFQSLSTHNNPLFHFILKDELLIYYFGLDYYIENYYCFAAERDAYIMARKEINDYLDKNFTNSKKYKKILDYNNNDFHEIISTKEISNYRILKRQFNNYNIFKKLETFKNYYDVDQIFDKFMLEISKINGKFDINDFMIKVDKKYDTFKLGEELLDICEMQKALSMKYNLDGSVKDIVEFVKLKNKYKKGLNKLEDYECDNENLKKIFENLTNIYDYFIYNRSYSLNHIIKELLDFSRYQGNDTKVLEEMMLTCMMFTDIILNSSNDDIFKISSKDIKFVDYSINQIHLNNTFVATDDEYFKKLKNEIYKNSIEILKIIKENVPYKKAKKRTYTK